MSKTSSRKAAKKRNRERRGLFATHSVVGYEQHAAVVRELERVSAVLADLIEEQKGAAVPARQVVAWVKNPELVKAVFDGSDDFYDCPHCDVQRSGAHYRTCVLASAWRATGHKYAEQDLARAHSEARQENNRRRLPGPNRHNSVRITGLFDRQPNTNQLRGYRDRQLMLNPRDLPRVEPTLREDGIGQFDGIEVVTSDLVRPGEAYLMDPALFAMPLPPATAEHGFAYASTPRGSENWRREYLGEFPATLDNSANPSSGPDYERWVSDNRGLDVVEAEARAHHIDLMLNRIGFPQS